MDIDANSLLASLLVSSVGFVAFTYGRKQSRFPHAIVGITMMVFPYFVSNTWVMLAIGAALSGALWGAVRLGW